jgi:hypothetical protein
VQVESDAEKDTVVSQSVEKDTEVDVNTQIILEVSKGPAENPQVTRDVVIDLRGMAAEGDAHVIIKRGDQVIFDQIVTAGTASVTLTGQVGLGTVYYEVIVNEEGWIVKESF